MPTARHNARFCLEPIYICKECDTFQSTVSQQLKKYSKIELAPPQSLIARGFALFSYCIKICTILKNTY